MHRVYYAGGEFVTSDEIATELLEFAAELARRETAVTVEIPALIDGRVLAVQIVVGPASQLAARPDPDEPHTDMTEGLTALRVDRDAAEHDRPVWIYDQPGHSFIDDW